MSFPHENHIKEQKQKIKKEHDARFLEVEEPPPTKGDIYDNWMDINESPQNLQ
jgi:hypothetical protein